MHEDRNNGNWPELKGKRQRARLDDDSLGTLKNKHNLPEADKHSLHKIKKERAERQLSNVQNIFDAMADYDDKQSKILKG